MVRKIPCQYCKQRRRKCEKTKETEPCNLCMKMKRKCIPGDVLLESDHDKDNLISLSDTSELVSLYEDVELLEKQLQLLEVNLDSYRQLGSLKQQHEPQWDIELTMDGRFRLLSKLKSLDELMLYGQCAIRYLSPFGHTFQKTTLVFELTQPSLLKSAIQFVHRLQLEESNDISTKETSRYFLSRFLQLIDPRTFVKQLVDIYFHCNNDMLPAVHEPSFRKHFDKLTDPIEDPITLAICTTSAVLTCKHSMFSTYEKRCVGEYFYQLCMRKLVDMFDDPDKALDSVIVVNILQVFMIFTLRINECKKWSAIATLLINNVIAENEGCLTNDRPDQLPWLTRIKYAVIVRNNVLAHCLSNIVQHIIDSRNDTLKPLIYKFDIIPDEPSQTKNMLRFMNYMLDLCFHPAFLVILTRIKTLATDDKAELNFEDIVLYEERMLAWWHNLPDDFKLCTETSGITKEMIDKTEDISKLTVACFVHMVTLSIHVTLVHIQPSKNIEGMYTIIKGKAVKQAIYSADVCLLIIRRLKNMDDFCFSSNRFLVRSIDSLMTLAHVKDESVSDIAKQKLMEYIYELYGLISPENRITSILSPYTIISIATPNSVPSVSELYKQYPIPAEALMFDLVRTTVEKNANSLLY
ncbi:MAG: hypothetical protein EXX96DRAFT_568259 [Benjaminiella poitrasii]|nr:MAG: hypothetical protein EXX96DRAFT_568259 [Benjaminiella poitrasii]